MKKILYILFVLLTVSFTDCNDEWTKEQYKQMVSIKSSPSSQGVTWRNVRYTKDGKVTYNVPIIISGSTENKMNRDIHFAIDPDTLAILNKEKFGDREELYFKLLPEQYYSFPETLTIPAGQSTSLLPVEYSLEGIDMADMWVLPIKIVSNDSYNYAVNPHKHYSKILIQPVPFNEFSGNYSGTKLLGYVNDDKTVPLNSSSHRAYVVNDSTVFFYAGMRSIDYTDRKDYKLYCRFTGEKMPDGKNYKAKLWTDNEELELVVRGQANYSVIKDMDAVTPNLEHIYITINDIDYDFYDKTATPGFSLKYTFTGSMTVQRNRNTLTPEEDQNIW